MIESLLTAGIIGLGLGFWLADMVETRRWRNAAIARRLNTSRR